MIQDNILPGLPSPSTGRFYVVSAIAAGDVIQLDLTATASYGKQVKTAAAEASANVGNGLGFAVAPKAYAAGSIQDFTVGGLATVKAATGLAAGKQVIVGGTAGTVVAMTAAHIGSALGETVTAESGGFATIFVYDRGLRSC